MRGSCTWAWTHPCGSRRRRSVYRLGMRPTCCSSRPTSNTRREGSAGRSRCSSNLARAAHRFETWTDRASCKAAQQGPFASDARSSSRNLREMRCRYSKRRCRGCSSRGDTSSTCAFAARCGPSLAIRRSRSLSSQHRSAYRSIGSRTWCRNRRGLRSAATCFGSACCAFSRVGLRVARWHASHKRQASPITPT